MSPRAATVALIASVALNLFAVTALATVLITRDRVETAVAAEKRPGREGSALQLIGELDPAVRERVRSVLRSSAQAARPDFEEARAKRREAVRLASEPSYDQARVTTLLGESRVAELRGRARLETDAAVLLATLEADDRAALARILTRRGRVDARGDGPAPQTETSQKS